MLLRRFYYPKLAQASYMVGCQATGEALVVDPHRDARVYVQAAEEGDLRIRYVTETHIHADYLSGSRELAKRSGGRLLLSAEGDETWRYRFGEEEGARLLGDGDRIELGTVLIDVLHTPGHTPEHLSFLVTDGAASDRPMGILTGDFVFVGDVGRPDLLEKAAGFRDTMAAGARDLYRSLGRLRDMPDYLQILPGHGAGSACGKALGAVPTSTLGYEKLVNWAFQCRTEDEFVRQVLEDQPEPPVYFARMKEMNRDGPRILGEMPNPRRSPAKEADRIAFGGGILIDARPADEFTAGHLPGSLSVPLEDTFPDACGWLVPYDRPLHLLVRDASEAQEAARDLAFIGLDRVEGYFDEEALAYWTESRGRLRTIEDVDWPEAERAVAEDGAVLLDVRGLTAWNEGHMPGAEHAFYGRIRDEVPELPKDRPLVLYCQRGKTSVIAASVLQAEGFEDVRSVNGGWSARA